MAVLDKDLIVTVALALLNEVGMDALTTRQLAQRLGVEQPALYWHFRSKVLLLDAMAEKAMLPMTAAPLPDIGDNWQRWFAENMLRFRLALLAHRDGARLHAGSHPRHDSLERLNRKITFLVASGLPEYLARMGMLAASHYTVGCVLEEQASTVDAAAASVQESNRAAAFEAGLELIVLGLSQRCL